MWRHGETRVIEVAGAELRVTDAAWPFALRHAQEIAAHWQRRARENPNFFNGAIHMLSAYTVSGDGVFSGRYLRTDFKSFLYWRETGWRDTSVMDAFGSALIRSAEGHVLLCRQRAGNLNSGLCVLPGGFIDGRDIAADGTIDIVHSVRREIAEETGLGEGQLRQAGGLMVATAGPALSIAVPWQSDLPGLELVRLANRHIAADPKGELAEVLAVAPEDALGGGLPLPDFVRVLLGKLADLKTPE